MKSIRQAKIWKNKIEWFKDGFVTEINIMDNRSNSPVLAKRIAVVKGDIALHLTFGWDDEEFGDYFQLTHVPSGLAMGDLRDGHELKGFPNSLFDELNEKAKETWAMYDDDLKQKLGLVDGLNSDLVEL